MTSFKVPFALLTLCLAGAAQAQLSSTVSQTNTQQTLTTINPVELTATNYTFAGPAPAQIFDIEITLTLQDGDSAPGDFDFDHLFLALDGVDTGIALNGFRGLGFEDTLTISGSIDAATSTALLAQFGDLQFAATIVTDNADDNPITGGNDMFVGNNTDNATTTLVLNAVPEPATVGLIGAGALLLLAPRVRRFRRNL